MHLASQHAHNVGYAALRSEVIILLIWIVAGLIAWGAAAVVVAVAVGRVIARRDRQGPYRRESGRLLLMPLPRPDLSEDIYVADRPA